MERTCYLFYVRAVSVHLVDRYDYTLKKADVAKSLTCTESTRDVDPAIKFPAREIRSLSQTPNEEEEEEHDEGPVNGQRRHKQEMKGDISARSTHLAYRAAFPNSGSH